MPLARKTAAKAAPKTVTIEDIVAYDEAQTEIKKLTAQKDAISKRIKAQYDPASYEIGGYSVELLKTIGTLKRAEFEADFPADEFPELYDLVPSTEAIKEQLGDERSEYYEPVLRLSVKKQAS